MIRVQPTININSKAFPAEIEFIKTKISEAESYIADTLNVPEGEIVHFTNTPCGANGVFVYAEALETNSSNTGIKLWTGSDNKNFATLQPGEYTFFTMPYEQENIYATTTNGSGQVYFFYADRGGVLPSSGSFSFISTNNQIYVGVNINGSSGITIDWGDGTSDTYSDSGWNYYGHIYQNTNTKYVVTLAAPELEGLDLSFNSLSFFDEGSKMPISLSSLSLSNNQLAGFDPSIALPSSLTYLSLGNNQLSTFDPSIALPSSLQTLELGGNQLTAFNPSIALPSSLQNLEIENNQLSSFDPSIALPSSLQTLDLSQNQLTTFNPSIALPSSLEYLYLSYNQLASFDPSIALPSSLQYLDLSQNQLTTFNPSIALPSSLQNIQIDLNNLTSFDPSIALPISLQHLYINNNQLTTFNPTLPLPSSLSSLNISDNPLTSFSTNSIQPTINSINLTQCSLTTSAINDILVSLDNLISGSGKVFLLAEQTTGAGPNGAGLTAKTDLISKGNTVITDAPSIYAPSLTTADISNITQTSATCGGNITSDGGASITVSGICWATHSSPTLADNYTTDGSLSGSFSSSISGMNPGTQYYVRSYATNSVGTGYGDEKSFYTEFGVGFVLTSTSPNLNITIVSDEQFVLDWGDGNTTTVNAGVGTYSHTYTKADSDPVSITFNSFLVPDIDLSNNSLTSIDCQYLPAQLRNLNLSNNNLTSFDPSIPLPSLLFTNLDLSNNQLTSFQPTHPLPNLLEFLFLYNNQISTFNPTFSLPNNGFQVIDVSNNQLTSFNPSTPLPDSLNELILNYNQITSFDPTYALPSSLTALQLAGNNLTTFNPSIALPNSIGYITLYQNQLTSFNPNLALPNSLQQLNISDNQITSFNPSIALPNSLQTLQLQYNNISTFNPTLPLPNLTSLELNNNNISSFNPNVLPTTLQYLYLFNNQLTTTIVNACLIQLDNTYGTGSLYVVLSLQQYVSSPCGSGLTAKTSLQSKGNSIVTDTAVPVITLTSASGTDSQSVSIGSNITPITYATHGIDVLNTVFVGVPAGITAAWANESILITGAPTSGGTFNFHIQENGGYGTTIAYLSLTAAFGVGITLKSTSNTVSVGLQNPTQFVLDWGDGNTTTVPVNSSTTYYSHTYTKTNTDSVNLTFNADDIQLLYLDGNHITDVTVNRLPSSLTKLSFNINALTSFDPTQPLPSGLTFLDLSSNQLTTFDPTYALPDALTQLYLGNNQLTTLNPSHPWPNSLRFLAPNNNSLTSFDPTYALPSTVYFIDFSLNQLTSFYPTRQLPPNIGFLNLQHNNLTSFNPVGDTPYINYLFLSNNNLTTFNFVPQSSLIFLSLDYNQLTSFIATSQLPSSLQYLTLNDNQLSSFDLSTALPSGLKQLSLSHNNITSFNPAQPLPSTLQYLYADNNLISTFNNVSNTLTDSLSDFVFNNNELTTDVINTILVDADNKYTGSQNIHFQLQGQSPIAPPNGAGDTAKTSLMSKGCTVQTDTWQPAFSFKSTASQLSMNIISGEQFVLDWGDGNTTTVNAGVGTYSHTYTKADSDQFNVTFKSNNISAIDLSNNSLTYILTSNLPLSLSSLSLINNQLAGFDPSIALPNSLQTLNLTQNKLTSFNPSIALPNSLQTLDLNYNQLTTFDPSIALPSSLQYLYLGGNQLTAFNPSLPLPSSLTYLSLGNNQLTTFDPSIALPSSLQYLSFYNNALTSFNPSIALPSSLQYLSLGGNQLTTTSINSILVASNNKYTANTGIFFTVNSQNPYAPPSGVGMTALTALQSKGYTVIIDTTAPVITLTSASGTDNQSVSIGSNITPITYSTHGIAGPDVVFSGFPPGVSAVWNNENVLISGAPSSGGTYNYTIQENGGYGTTTVNGTITVTFGVGITLKSTSNTVSVGLQNASQFVLDWGDGNTTTVPINSSTTNYTHTYTKTNTDSVNLTFNSDDIQQLYLETNQITNAVINRLPSSLSTLSFNNNALTSFDPIQPLPSGLSSLILSSNQLTTFDPTYALPDTIRVLLLNYNNLTVINPSHPWPSNLFFFSVSNNQLTSFDPTQNLPDNLNNFTLSNNQLTSFYPTRQLPLNLRYLDLQYNNLTSFNPAGDAPYINYLFLSNNNLTTFNFVPQSSLILLQLGYNQLTSFIATSQLPSSLKYLILNDNQLSSFDLSTALPSGLTLLQLSHNNITSFNPAQPLPSTLQYLYADNNLISTFNNISNALTDSLSDFVFNNNELTTDVINTILVDADNKYTGSQNASFQLQGQNPLAPPNGAGDTAKTSLMSKGCTVQTDTWQPAFSFRSNSTTLSMNITSGEQFIIDWGDGNTTTASSGSGTYSYTYHKSNTDQFNVTFKSNNISAIDLSNNSLTYILTSNLPLSLTSLIFTNNQLTSFDPTYALPSSLTYLSLYNNALTTFNPSIALPNSLHTLSLVNNQLASFDPSLPLPSSLQGLNIDSNNLTTFSPTLPLPSSLKQLLLYGNQLTTFNTNALTDSLINLSIASNQLPTSVINSVLIAADTKYTAVRSIAFTMNSQNPLAPPSGAGITAKTDLAAKGYTVTTD